VSLLIGGELRTIPDTVSVRNPATGVELARVAAGGDREIDAAVTAARDALENPTWARAHPAARGRILLAAAGLIRADTERLALLEAQDTGKPLRQARADVSTAARYFEFYGGAADKILGETIPLGPDLLDFTLREPIGVSAQIVPWNYPLQIASRGVAPALACGCSVVLKPSTRAPLSCLRLGEILLEAGLPPGVLNVVTGRGSEAGTALVRHPGVSQVTFTGSVEVAQDVVRHAAENLLPTVIEGGGKSPNIVFDDADLDRAAPAIVNAIIQNAGQTCSAASRLIVDIRVQDSLTDRVATLMTQVVLGPGEEDPDMGPLIDERQLERVQGYVDVAVDEGANVISGGKRSEAAGLGRGNFMEPTLIDAVRPEMRIAQEEIFGPVLVVLPFETASEAITLANGTRYGLVTGIWTRDLDCAVSTARQIEAGQIFVNAYGAGGGVELPFGGYKRSGYGREKGLEALRSYVQVKNVCIRTSTTS
jgi:aldehyde dehydrogenase (NAD+)